MRFIFADTDHQPVYYDTFLDPFFPESGMHICVAVTDKGLASVRRVRPSEVSRSWKLSPKHAGGFVSMLKDFLTGENVRWDEVTVVLNGTDLQREVWQQLIQIPYGETISYSEMARRVDHPNAVRAVGSACGANPIPLIIPCHRVIASDGSFGGFAWGLPFKERLLAMELSRAEALAA
ncbi:MAG: methylated-DNA--[protein]-cysteine S-methyltransferase [Rickettsiales bacterium]